MRWLMIILVFYASQGMSQEHYVSYIDINNTGQFAWQIEEHGKDFILAVQTRCFDSENSCGGIISVDKDGNIVDNALFEGFSGNPNSILIQDSLKIIFTGELSTNRNYIGICLNENLDSLNEFYLKAENKYYNYYQINSLLLGNFYLVGGNVFINENHKSSLMFVVDYDTNIDSIIILNPDEKNVSTSTYQYFKSSKSIIYYQIVRVIKDSKLRLRIVRLDTSFHQTFEWSMEVNDNAIPRGCVTRNEDMIITIPDEGLGNRRDLWAIDTTGQVKWKWKWPENSGRTNILRVKEAENGDLLVMGQILSQSIFNDLRYIAFVMRLTPDGEQKWIRYFKIADPDTRLSNYVSDLAELDNGDLQLTGQSHRIIFDADIGEYRPDQDIFWARIGGDGCINGDCSEVYTITDTQDPQVEAAIPLTIFPNPIDSDVLHVETTVRGIVDLYSQEGQQVYSTTLDAGRHTIPMAGLTAGVYVVRLRTMEGKVYSEKVVRL